MAQTIVLPTFESCQIAFAEGRATALQLFVLNHQIPGEEGLIWRLQLSDALNEVIIDTINLNKNS